MMRQWTLEKVQEYCKKRYSCRECIFYDKGKHYDEDALACILTNDPPRKWKIGPIHFTPEEVERAKTIKEIFPGAKYILKLDKDGKLAIRDSDDYILAMISQKMFPSIRVECSCELDDITKR